MMFEEVFMVDFHQNTYNRLNFYVEEQVYWAPASMTSDLYAQLALKKYREISRNQIKSVSKSQISCAYRPFFYTVESWSHLAQVTLVKFIKQNGLSLEPQRK